MHGCPSCRHWSRPKGIARLSYIFTTAPGDHAMFVSHLESALDSTSFQPDRVMTVHEGRPLWVRYDLGAVRKALGPEDVTKRVNSLWRYRELLPLPGTAEPVTLGEGMSPLLPC